MTLIILQLRKKGTIMIQYIASDVDGTLLHGHATTLNPELFDIIRQLKEHGIHFIAASGRQYKNLQRLFAPVKDDISYVAENGSMCVHDGKIVSLGHIILISSMKSQTLQKNMVIATL